VVAGIVAGAAWAAPAAWARAYRGVNEILATLLFNFLAAALLLWSLRTWLATPEPVATPRSETLPPEARIPLLLEDTRLHAAALLVLVLAAALAWWRRTRGGFRVDVFGARPRLGRRLGVRPTRTVIGTMLLAGAAAGLAGWLQVGGVQGTLYPSVAGGLGFTGILVALLGGLRPVTILVAALVYAVLVTGADGMQAGTGVPSSIATVLQALLLIAVALAFEAQRRRLDRAAA
jgi:simple sugar transport system permease protein